MAEAGVPWRTEPLAYRSDLGDRLPAGLRMPRSVGVFDLDEKSAAVWLEDVATVPMSWSTTTYERAAFLLGRLAASPRVRELAQVGQLAWTVHDYLHGRLEHQVLPLLRDPEVWRHPLVAAAFDDTLRSRLLDAARRAADLVDELGSMPLGTAHGDACPNNLLLTADDDGFVLIDYGFWCEAPLGFDLAQLLVGDVQIGRRDAEGLVELERSILPSYVDGLRAEGCDVDASLVRRGHALQLMVFTGLSTLPVRAPGREPDPGAAPGRLATSRHRHLQPRPPRGDRALAAPGFLAEGQAVPLHDRQGGLDVPFAAVGRDHGPEVDLIGGGVDDAERLLEPSRRDQLEKAGRLVGGVEERVPFAPWLEDEVAELGNVLLVVGDEPDSSLQDEAELVLPGVPVQRCGDGMRSQEVFDHSQMPAPVLGVDQEPVPASEQ